MKQFKIILNNTVRVFFQSAFVPFFFLLSTTFASAQMIIDLVEFKATLDTGSIVLTWEVLLPKSGDSYTIERSSGNGAFVEIGSVKELYAFIDQKPLEGQNTYRLSQISTSGQVIYSNKEASAFYTSIYYSRELALNPNPTSNNLQVHYKVEKDAVLYIQLLDQMGNLLEQHTPDTHSGGHRHINLNVNSYPSGIYFIRLVDNKGAEVQQFYKQ